MKRLLIIPGIALVLLATMPFARDLRDSMRAQADGAFDESNAVSPQTFRAPRPESARPQAGQSSATGEAMSESASAADSPPMPPRYDVLADVLVSVIQGIAAGKVDPASRSIFEDNLADALYEESVDNSRERHIKAAQVMVQFITERSNEARKAGTPIGSMNMRAVQRLANDLAEQMRAELPGFHSRSIATRQVLEVEVPSGYHKTTWNTLGGFTYRMGMELPEDVQALHGKKVGISGYVIPLFSDNDDMFLLVESLWDCCFGMPPEVHQGIVVFFESATGGELADLPVLVLGQLAAGEQRDVDGFVTSVYRIKADSVVEIE